MDAAEAAWLAALVREADPADLADRLVTANALAALAGDPSEPARDALRALLVGGAAPPAGEFARCLAVELLAGAADHAAQEILAAARTDPSPLVRAKAARAALAEGGRP